MGIFNIFFCCFEENYWNSCSFMVGCILVHKFHKCLLFPWHFLFSYISSLLLLLFFVLSMYLLCVCVCFIFLSFFWHWNQHLQYAIDNLQCVFFFRLSSTKYNKHVQNTYACIHMGILGWADTHEDIRKKNLLCLTTFSVEIKTFGFVDQRIMRKIGNILRNYLFFLTYW